jgi:molecular chaperone GrpE
VAAVTESSPPEGSAHRTETDSAERGSPATAALGEGPSPEEKTPGPEEELSRVRDQLLRTAADFDNFRKRSRKEIADAERQGRSDLLRELLPVFDNLERATAHASSTTDVQALADGIALVMRQFLDTLSRIGIERVATLGVPFDPMVHEAIQHLPTTEHTPGTVAAEVQAGYRLGERLIRPALVVVAKPPTD